MNGLLTAAQLAPAVDTYLAATTPERRWDAETTFAWSEAEVDRPGGRAGRRAHRRSVIRSNGAA